MVVPSLISIRLLGRILVVLGSSTILLVTQHYLKPRLPIYIIQMNLLPSFFNKQPSNTIHYLPIQFIKSRITKQWQTIMSTNIHFYNENFLHITVHAMTFDIYIEKYIIDEGESKLISDGTSSTSTGTRPLLHVGTITDQYQHVTYDHRHPKKGTSSNILWSIPGRSNFTELYCPLYMSLQPILPVPVQISPLPASVGKPHKKNKSKLNVTTTSNTNYTQQQKHQRNAIITYYKSILHVLYQLMKHTFYNIFYNHQTTKNHNSNSHQSLSYYTIPTTGVAHIRTSAIPPSKSTNQTHTTDNNNSPLGSIPFTVSMICDNIINLLQFQIIGTYCTIHTIQPGWNQHISIAAQNIRNYAIQHLSIYNTTTGSIHPQ